jgi:hypothetical protein
MDDSKDTKDKSNSRKRILETGVELKKALAAWDDLSKEPQGPSADEQVLNDVKNLLKELKSKIEEFK